ncbi:hypothetical protein DK419_00990 [Methylobacterium terrae]|uniref:Uncharacterized protein n=1 Tax=Methylobacterium terrae TaxID=2202827 RepID=A0A2U8WI46_9HYPH|nr:hypothetical protein DK419_00990 [Methylobacterium terrae]
MASPAGLEPATPGFVPLRLSPPPRGVRGLDYPFTVASKRPLGAARLVSTPSQPGGRAWLGIGVRPGEARRFPRL